jgi:hypothetical protein
MMQRKKSKSASEVYKYGRIYFLLSTTHLLSYTVITDGEGKETKYIIVIN